MNARAGQTVVLVGHFIASGVAATGLTVTGKVWELYADGSKAPNDTTGTTLTVAEVGGGAYRAVHTMAGDGVPLGVLTTAGTADVKSVPASALSLANLDAAVSGIPAAVRDLATSGLAALKTLLDAISAKTANLPADTNTLLVTTGIKAASVPAVVVTTNNDKTGYSGIATNMPSGSGEIAYTYRVLLDTNGDGVADVPNVGIADVQVIVTSDAAGTVRLAAGVTDSQGNVIFHLDAGTAYFWRYDSAHVYVNPDTEVVA